MRLLERPKGRREARGIGLIELMVSLALTAVIVSGAFQIFQEGMQLYRTNQAAADAQSNIAKVLGMVALDLANAAAGLTVEYSAGGPASAGLAFATPLGEGGAVRYDPDNGDIYWQKYVCYYFVPDPDPKGHDGKIFRACEDVEDENAMGPGHRDIALVADFLDTNSTDYFLGSPLAERRLVADGISGFDVVRYDGTEFGTTAIKRAFDITVEAGDKARAMRDSYFIKVTSRAVPRGGGG